MSAEFHSAGVSVGDLTVQTARYGRTDQFISTVEIAPSPGPHATVAYHQPGLTEWWRPQGIGLEQGWTLSEAPAGDGWLYLEVIVSGQVSATPDGAIIDDGARLWSVQGLTAWDATGRRLPVTMNVQDQRLIITANDAGAVWPVTIDPIYTTATRTYSGPNDSHYGRGFATGNFNGDAYTDLVVAAPDYSSGQGRMYIYYGNGSSLPSSSSTRITGASGANLGSAIAGAGDVNDDGYDDIIAIAGGTGTAGIYYGGTSGLANTAAWTTTAATSATVAGAGDLDGNGYDDVVIGDPANSSFTVYYSSATGLSSSATWYGDVGSGLGQALAGAGDLNGDGYDDLAIGADVDDTTYGAVAVFTGSAAGLSSSPTWQLHPSGAEASWSLARAGDTDADGDDELLIAWSDGSTGTVGLYDVSGGSLTAVTTLSGSSSFGQGLGRAGDLNGDGYDDVLIGTPDSGAGNATLYHGATSGLSVAVNSITGPKRDSRFGNAVAALGDLNADGFDDIAIAADNYDSDGYVAVYLGFDTDADGDGYLGYIDGGDDCDDFHDTVFPGNIEICDDLDNDCSGNTDGDAIDRLTWYRDADGDNYTLASPTTLNCDEPSGYSALSAEVDCQDSNRYINPGATEYCDDVDNNCNSDIDGDAVDKPTWYDDDDGDGFGRDETAYIDCDGPPGYVLNGRECDDTDPDTAPTFGYNEADPTACYTDVDRDGYGEPRPVAGVSQGTDCDEDDELINPGALEITGNHIDENCTAPYSGIIEIDGGAAYTNATSVSLALGAYDQDAVTEMCVSTSLSCTSWVAYAESYTFSIGPATATRTVYVTYRDADGETSERIYDQILQDRTVPVSGSFTATAGPGRVDLLWSGFSDAHSGLASYTVVMDTGSAPASCSAGTTVYTGTDTSLTVSSLSDGTTYGFRVCATDNAGNTSTGLSATAIPTSETNPPTGTVVINGDATWTNKTSVTLTLDAADDTEVDAMCVSRNSVCTAWESYAGTRGWTLSGSGLTRRVYVTFRDPFGNTSATAVDTINIDTVKPTDGAATLSTSAGTADLSWSGFTDTTSGLSSYTVAYSRSSTPPASCSTGTIAYTGADTSTTLTGLSAGRIALRVCATDAAGNRSTGTTASGVVP